MAYEVLSAHGLPSPASPALSGTVMFSGTSMVSSSLLYSPCSFRTCCFDWRALSFHQQNTNSLGRHPLASGARQDQPTADICNSEYFFTHFFVCFSPFWHYYLNCKAPLRQKLSNFTHYSLSCTVCDRTLVLYKCGRRGEVKVGV